MQKRLLALLGAFLFFSIFIFTLHTVSPIQAVEGFFQRIGVGPKIMVFDWSRNRNSSQSDVEKLTLENKKLLSRFADYENLKRDNIALRSQFQNTTIPASHLVPASIIGFMGNVSHPSIIFINRGKDNKLYQGMAVVIGNDLVGKVQTVSENISSVMTVTNKNFSVSARSLQDGSIGIVHGEDDFLLLDQVVITDTLKNGDLVETRGDSNGNQLQIISGIVVGKISSIAKNETAGFQSAKIESMVNYSKLTNVFIVVKK